MQINTSIINKRLICDEKLRVLCDNFKLPTYLQIQMNNVLRVHVLHALAYLLNKLYAVFLRQSKVVGCDSLEELASRNAEKYLTAYNHVYIKISWLNYVMFSLKFKTHYSVTITISFGLLKAAARRNSFGCFSLFMISISSWTCLRSTAFIVFTNLAARLSPDDFSTIFRTIPYFPLPSSSNIS